MTFLGWLGLLGWDNDLVVRGIEETGPYEPWQVQCLVALLAVTFLVALVVRSDPLRTSLALTCTLSFCMLLSFTVLAAPSPDASLWPIGIALVFCGAAIGCAVVVGIVAGVRAMIPGHPQGPPRDGA